MQILVGKNIPKVTELKTYLVGIAQKGGDRDLVERCHELIIKEQLRAPDDTGPKLLGG
jgi:hypothetical protein